MDGTLLFKYRKRAKLTQRELAERVQISRGRISQIEADPQAIVGDEICRRLAKELGISVAQLMGDVEDGQKLVYLIPIKGTVPSDTPLRQEADGYQEMPASQLPGHKEKNLFALRVSGDSMKRDGIQDGMLLIVDQSMKPDDGELGVLMVGETLSARHIKRQRAKIFLVGSNPPEPFFMQVPTRLTKILGKVVLWGFWSRPP